jgi:hypothetical protein
MDTMLQRSVYHNNAELAQGEDKQTLCGFDDLAAELETLSCLLKHLEWWLPVCLVMLS